MGKFGRSNSGRFGGGNKSSGGNGGRKFGGGSERSSGGNRGGYNKGGGDNNFIRVGSVTLSKKVVEEQGEDIINEVKDSGLQLWVNFYLPKGTKSMTITNDTRMLVSLKEVKNAPEFIVGSVQVSSDNE